MSDITVISADIVSAFVSKNSIPADDLVALLKNVHGTMSGIMKQPAALEDSKPEPVVSIKKSVRNEAITCLACGMHLKTLKRHVMASHGQTLADLQGALVAASGLPDHGSRLRGNALGTGHKGRAGT